MVANSVQIQIEKELQLFLEGLSVEQMHEQSKKKCRQYLEQKLNMKLSKYKQHIKSFLQNYMKEFLRSNPQIQCNTNSPNKKNCNHHHDNKSISKHPPNQVTSNSCNNNQNIVTKLDEKHHTENNNTTSKMSSNHKSLQNNINKINQAMHDTSNGNHPSNSNLEPITENKNLSLNKCVNHELIQNGPKSANKIIDNTSTKENLAKIDNEASNKQSNDNKLIPNDTKSPNKVVNDVSNQENLTGKDISTSSSNHNKLHSDSNYNKSILSIQDRPTTTSNHNKQENQSNNQHLSQNTDDKKCVSTTSINKQTAVVEIKREMMDEDSNNSNLSRWQPDAQNDSTTPSNHKSIKTPSSITQSSRKRKLDGSEDDAIDKLQPPLKKLKSSPLHIDDCKDKEEKEVTCNDIKMEIKSEKRVESQVKLITPLSPLQLQDVKEMTDLVEAENMISELNEKMIKKQEKRKNIMAIKKDINYDNIEHEALKNKLTKCEQELKKSRKTCKEYAALLQPKVAECQKLRKENKILNENIEVLKSKYEEEIKELKKRLKNETENTKEERFKLLRKEKYILRINKKYDFVCNKYNIDKDSVVIEMNRINKK